MGCAAGPHGLPSPRARVTKLQAITWEVTSFTSAENEFQLSYTPDSLVLPLSASPSFSPGRPGPQESLGRTRFWGWIFCFH